MTGDARVAAAAVRAVVYGDLFDFPLTFEEIVRFLPGVSAPPAQVAASLDDPRLSSALLTRADGFYCLRGREHLGGIRRERQERSAAHWQRARGVGRVLSRTPFVRLVAVTGAVAVSNCADGADVDLLVITAPARVWLTRGFVVLLSRALPAPALCPNYVLAESRLALRDRDFYAARELAQMVPLYGAETYRRLLAANPWARVFLPNAFPPVAAARETAPGRLGRGCKHALEGLARWTGASAIDRWELERRVARARAAGRLHAPSVVLDAECCKAHFTDYPRVILDRYRAALARLELAGEETSGDRLAAEPFGP